jgi:hypothetical protein
MVLAMRFSSVLLVALASAISCSTTTAFQQHGRASVTAPALTRFGIRNSAKHPFLLPKSQTNAPDDCKQTTTTTTTARNLFNIFQREPTPEPEPLEPIPSFAINIAAASAWVTLVAWTFTLAPGELNSATDTAMLTNIIADPVHPGINALYYTLFNFFAVIPVLLASVILPQGRSGIGLPAGPFLAMSTFIGYFGFGPYLALRAPPKDVIEDPSEVSWFTGKVLENKIFSALTVALSLYLPFGSGLLSAYQENPEELISGFVDLISTSRFASVSLADLSLLLAVTVSATPRDYMLRKPDADIDQARKVAAWTALVPFLGRAVYCALRPPLPQEEDYE